MFDELFEPLLASSEGFFGLFSVGDVLYRGKIARHLTVGGRVGNLFRRKASAHTAGRMHFPLERHGFPSQHGRHVFHHQSVGPGPQELLHRHAGNPRPGNSKPALVVLVHDPATLVPIHIGR